MFKKIIRSGGEDTLLKSRVVVGEEFQRRLTIATLPRKFSILHDFQCYAMISLPWTY